MEVIRRYTWGEVTSMTQLSLCNSTRCRVNKEWVKMRNLKTILILVPCILTVVIPHTTACKHSLRAFTTLHYCSVVYLQRGGVCYCRHDDVTVTSCIVITPWIITKPWFIRSVRCTVNCMRVLCIWGALVSVQYSLNFVHVTGARRYTNRSHYWRHRSIVTVTNCGRTTTSTATIYLNVC